MKTDFRPDSGDEPRDGLRAMLHEWKVPPAPPALEADLRRAFRQRRRPRRLAPWLALAAALAGLALWPLLREGRAPAASRGTEAPTSPSLAGEGAPGQDAAQPAPALEAPRQALAAARVAASGARPARRAPAKPAVPPVVVEPGQAELLAQLGAQLQDLRPPTTVLSGAEVALVPAHAPGTPTFEDAQVPRYEGEWERVAGVWPLVQLSAPSLGR